MTMRFVYLMTTLFWTLSCNSAPVLGCPNLSQENGKVILSDDIITTGTTAAITCNTGYMLTGSNVRTCQDSETWSGTETSCTMIGCPNLSQENGMVTLSDDSIAYLSIATITCNPGYTLTGSNVRTCQDSGTWSGTDTFCTIIDCGSFSPPMNGFVDVPEGTSFGKTAYYRCDTGYQMAGPRSTVCSTGGYWDPQITPSCILKAQDMGYQPTQEMVEQENQRQEDMLSNKVKALKSLTIDIGTEVRDQNKMLLGMDDDFESSGNLLQASMNKLKAITKMGGHRQMWYLILFCVFVFFVLWMIVRSR